jgi:hypothetical protein
VHAIYIAWKVDSGSALAARHVRERLKAGEEARLYRVRAWTIVNGEVRALLIPTAPLEAIVDSVLAVSGTCLLVRWAQGKRACASAEREIHRASRRSPAGRRAA